MKSAGGTRLFDRRLVVVMGKGGVGRTTVAAAMGLAAARTGRRVCLIELSGMASAAPLFGLQGRSYIPRNAAPGLDLMSVTPEEALDDFGRRKLRVTRLLGLVLRSRVTRAFIEAVPGLHDLLQLGKIENMLQEPRPEDVRYDLAVLDAPATGHGLTMLAAAHSMTDLTRAGPFAELARTIEVFLADPARCALVLVTLPEALPVNESVEMIEALRADGAHLAGVVVNQVHPPRLPDTPPWPEASAALARAAVEGEGMRDLVRLADHVWERQAAQAAVMEGLTDAVTHAAGGPVPVVELPSLRPLGRDGLERLAERLATLDAGVQPAAPARSA